MKSAAPLFLGIFGTFAFSWFGLALIPSLQIGHLDPQTDEDGNDAYPAPQSGLVERGRRIYIANGCAYCHTQMVRPAYAAADIDRKWGQRRSAPRDYIFDRPVLLGAMRVGPDLANVGHRAPSDDATAPPPDATKTGGGAATAGSPAAPAAAAKPAGAPAAPAAAPGAAAPPSASGAPLPQATGSAAAPAPSPAVAVAAPTADAPVGPTTVVAPDGSPLQYSAAWHYRHLYDPRSVSPYSTMPPFRFLFEKRRITGEPDADALRFGDELTAGGWEVVPTADARALVAYLMSRDQTHELKEVKSATPVSPPAPGK